MKTSGLTIRQHEREGVDLPVELIIQDQHCPQLRFAMSAASAGRHSVRGRAIDISGGGMGVECRQFLPRMTEAVARIYDPNPVAGASRDGSPGLQIAFEHVVKVRRVWMAGREPVYAIGLAFVNPTPDIELVVARMLERIQSGHEAAAGEPGRGVPRA